MREALQAVLAAADWLVAASIRNRLKEEDSYRRRGAVLRARLPTIPGEEEDLFAMAAESKRPPLAATRVRTAWPSAPDQPPSRILTDPADIEAEITSYFEALFHGRHMVSEAAPEPVDSGQPFSPDFTFFDDFTAHLPQLSQAQREGLVAPIQLLELMAAVEGAPAANPPGWMVCPTNSVRQPFTQ